MSQSSTILPSLRPSHPGEILRPEAAAKHIWNDTNGLAGLRGVNHRAFAVAVEIAGVHADMADAAFSTDVLEVK